MRDATHTSPPLQHTAISTRRARGELPLPSDEHPLFPSVLLTSLILNNLGRASPQHRVARVTKFSFLLLYHSSLWILPFLFFFFFRYCTISFASYLSFLFIYSSLMALVSLERVIQYVSRKIWWRIILLFTVFQTIGSLEKKIIE